MLTIDGTAKGLRIENHGGVWTLVLFVEIGEEIVVEEMPLDGIDRQELLSCLERAASALREQQAPRAA